MKKYLVCAFLASFALVGPLSAIDDESNCERMERAWLAANASNLPQSYEDILVFPEDERRIAFRHVDAATQSAIWRGHFAAFAARNDLDSAQRELIARASLVSSPELFGQHAGDPGFAAAQAPLLQVVADAEAHFSPEQIRDIFYRLGLQEGGSQPYKPIQGPTNCNCTFSTDCHGGTCSLSSFCAGTVSGCGPDWTGPCLGRC